NFGRGEAGQDSIAQGFDGGFGASKFFGDFIALSHRGGVAPELGGTDDFAFVIQGNEPMLLAADADGFDFGSAGLSGAQGLANGTAGGVAPGMRVLLLCAGREVGDQIVNLRGGGKDFAVLGVHHQYLGGLRAAIDAN
ncbi:MAG: hypothetical protein JWQ71_4633, partial [Pedosphaera sp.]|nr:hypothetical protein [Pedosphaera sp.]